MGWFEDLEAKGEPGQFIPCREGQSATFVVKDIVRVMNDPKHDPKDRKGDPQGWHLDIIATDGRRLSVSAYVLQSKLREAGRKDRDNPKGALIGREITIQHPGRGEYSVSLGKAKPLPPIEPDPPQEDVPF